MDGGGLDLIAWPAGPVRLAVPDGLCRFRRQFPPRHSKSGSVNSRISPYESEPRRQYRDSARLNHKGPGEQSMTSRHSRISHGRKRWLTAVIAAAGAAVAITAFGIGPAAAVHDTGSFELDGNATNGAAPGDDWDNVCHQVIHSDTACSTTSDTTGASAVDWVPEPNHNATIFTGGGSKDPSDINQWAWKDGAGGLPDKDNLLHSFAARYPSTSEGDVLYFGSDRLDNSGDAHRRTLASSSNANCATAAPNDSFCGLVNANTITMPWSFTDKSGTPNNGALNGEFYEGGVNLTKLGLANKCFSSVASETRSSTSTTATLKDFILGNLQNCGSTTTTQSSITGSTSIGTGSVAVSDSATVTVQDITPWSGTVQFHLRGPIGSSLEVSTDIGGPVAVSNTTPTVQSDTAHVTAAGDYCWSAHFHSTTTGVTDSNDDGTNECFTVTPVTPSLATTASDDVLLGNPISDSAALSGK